MGYYLKIEKGGILPEKTYEFSAPLYGDEQLKQKGHKSRKKRYRNASEEAKYRIEYEKRTGKQYRTSASLTNTNLNGTKTNNANNANNAVSRNGQRPASPGYRLSAQRNIRSGNGFENESTYSFDSVNTNGQSNVFTSAGANRQSAKNKNAVHYVIDKNGKKAVIRSQAELMRIRREREAAIKNEQKRMLEEARIAKAEEHMRTVRARTSKFSTGFILAAVVCTLMLSVMILNMVLINERNHEISELESELNSIEEVKTELQQALEKKNDLIYIEEYAVNRLGMVKADRLSRQYVSISTADKIELVGEEENSSSSSEAAEVVKSTLKSKLQAFFEIFN